MSINAPLAFHFFHVCPCLRNITEPLELSPSLITLCACRYLSLADAQSKALKLDFTDPVNKPVQPKLLGTKVCVGWCVLCGAL